MTALLARLTELAPVIDLRGDPRFLAEDFADSVHARPVPPHSVKLARATAEGVVQRVLSR